MERKSAQFSWLALGLALLLALVVARFGVFAPPGDARLPLLFLLLMSEFGALVAFAGSVSSALAMRRTGFRPSLLLVLLACVALAVALALMGLKLWPQTAA